MRITLVALASPALLLTAGCLHQELYAGEPVYAEPPRAPERVVVEEVEVAYAGPDQATPLRASESQIVFNGDRPRPDPVPFCAGAAYGTLGHVDVSSCGLPPGYWRMRVTFNRGGHIVHAAIEHQMPPTREALACVAEQLRAALVPAFDGDDGVTLTSSVFVSGAQEPEDPQEYIVHARR